HRAGPGPMIWNAAPWPLLSIVEMHPRAGIYLPGHRFSLDRLLTMVDWRSLMVPLKLKPEKLSRLLESGVNGIENDPRELVRKSRLTRARSRELLERSRKLMDAMRQRRANAE